MNTKSYIDKNMADLVVVVKMVEIVVVVEVMVIGGGG